MRPSRLLLLPLIAPLLLIGPAEAAFLPSCCVVIPPPEDVHADPHTNDQPILVRAEVRRKNERALSASAEAPVSQEAPLADAIALPEEETPRILVPIASEVVGAPVEASLPASVTDQVVPVPAGTVRTPISPLAPGLPLADVGAPTAPDTDSPFTSPCCQVEGELHQPDPRDSEDTPVPISAKVKNREERALEAAVQLPVPAEVPLVHAIGVPLDAQRGVSEPERVQAGKPTPSSIDPNGPRMPADLIPTPPCCQIVGELHGPDPHSGDSPILVGAKVRSRDERSLDTAVELATPDQVPLADAIGVPLDAQRGVSEPEHRPAEVNGPSPAPDVLSPCCQRELKNRPAPVDATGGSLHSLAANAEVVVAVIVFLAAIGVWLWWRRRRPAQLEQQPVAPRGLPDEWPLLDAVPLPTAEPELALARARARERELEPA